MTKIYYLSSFLPSLKHINMLFFLLTLLSLATLTVSSPTSYLVFGLKADFSLYGNRTTCDSSDNSCNELLCSLLNKNNSCVAYVAFVPFLATGLDCNMYSSNVSTNIIVFGTLTSNNQIVNPQTCTNLNECLTIGCTMYNLNTNIDWFLFSGQCIYSNSKIYRQKYTK